MISFNYNLFLQYIVYLWIASGAIYIVNGLCIEKDSAKRAASVIVGVLLFCILGICAVS